MHSENVSYTDVRRGQIGILSKFLRNFNNLFDNGFIRHYIIFKIISLFQKVSLFHGTASKRQRKTIQVTGKNYYVGLQR